MLGRKQSISNNDWKEAVNNIESLISRQEVKQIEEITINEIKRNTKDKKTAYAWSGGKDSIVLSHLCRKAGIKNCMIGLCNLEYPAFLNWIQKNKPENLEIINTGQDINWLIKYKNFLFPKSSNILSRWYSIVQHKAQEKYFKDNKLDIIILGRRTADGNYTGKNGLYTNLKGIRQYSPIWKWKHEQILGYIHYNGLKLPPIYGWKDGYKQGTHPWAARICKSTEQGWREIYDIDKNIVYNASKYIESAELFLRRI